MTDKTKFEITLAHDEYGEVKTTVEVAATTSFEDHYAGMIQQAQKNAASRFVHYESFGNDSAYAHRLSEVGDEFKVRDAEMVSDAPLLRYAVSGDYTTDEGGRWSDWVFARSAADAEFSAKWEMATNESVSPDIHDEFEGTMQDIHITDCHLEPVTLDEAKTFLGEMSRFTIPGDVDDIRPMSAATDEELVLYSMIRKARLMLAGTLATPN